MTAGQTFSVVCIWVALSLMLVSASMRLSSTKATVSRGQARWIWTASVAFYLVHVLTAFAYFHGWSHQHAVEHTAVRTQEMVGWNWGGGIYLNHGFTFICVLETVWWWADERSYLNRAAWIRSLIFAYVIFIIVNATVVFGSAAARWITLTALVVLLILWIRRLGQLRNPRRDRDK